MKAYLVLENGTVFEGISCGVKGTAYGEVVFSTSMTGYQEMLTDPSYRGQILTYTYPLIGNYGVNEVDVESARIQVGGVVMREMCRVPSHWQSTKTLQEYLEENQVVGIEGIDTRALTRHLRVRGVMMGVISTEGSQESIAKKFKEIPNYGDVDYVMQVSTREIYRWRGKKQASFVREAPRYHVVVVDLGVKYNILRMLTKRNCRVTVVPCATKAQEILRMKPDGIVFSPGPGDPERLDYAVDTMKFLINPESNPRVYAIPIFGICLGHQILCRAFGAKTFKLKFGHRGANHPVRDTGSGCVYITTQNHGYAVEAESLAETPIEISCTHLNDGTVEGVSHKELPVFSIQYHPEAHPGPLDSTSLFDRFTDLMEKQKV